MTTENNQHQPALSCFHGPSYRSRTQAKRARRGMFYRRGVRVESCERCDGFHVVPDLPKLTVEVK